MGTLVCKKTNFSLQRVISSRLTALRLNQTRKRRHCFSKCAVASSVADNSFAGRKTNCSAVQESSGSSPPVRWLSASESSRIAIPRSGSRPPVRQLCEHCRPSSALQPCSGSRPPHNRLFDNESPRRTRKPTSAERLPVMWLSEMSSSSTAVQSLSKQRQGSTPRINPA